MPTKLSAAVRERSEPAALHVEINEEKSRLVDLAQGEAFGFLGFDFRCVRSLRGVWRPQYTPKLKRRTALLQKLKEVFRHFQSQPIKRVIERINPVLRGFRWKRWSRSWLCATLGLFNGYRVVRKSQLKALPTG